MDNEAIDHSLWLHRESVVISAENYDLGSFTPQFLSTISPGDWICSRATRGPDRVDIQYGPIEWTMTEKFLWIGHQPDCSLQESLQPNEGWSVTAAARQLLEEVPYFPYRQFWLFWNVSALHPAPEQWINDKFTPAGWPGRFLTVSVRPTLHAYTTNGLWLQLHVRSGYREGKPAVHFDCHSSLISTGQDIQDMIRATVQRDEWLTTATLAITHLLEGGEPS